MSETKNYAWPVTTTSKDVYEYFEQSVWNRKDILKNKKIVVFGAGIRGTLLSIILEKAGYEEFYFTDNNSEKWGGYINSHLIMPINEVYQQIDQVYVLIAIEGCAKVEAQLEEKGFVSEVNYSSLDTSLYDFYMEEFGRKTDGKVLVMGDCGVTHISLLDENKANMGEIIQEKIGKDSVKVLAMHGMGMHSFYHILKTQIKTFGIPKVVVLMTNFETFTGKQHLLPRSQHLPLLEKVYACSREDSEFQEYLEVVRERTENFQIEIASQSADSDYENRARIYMRYNYMYRLKEENENIQYMQKIIQMLNEEGVKVITFIPPVNYQLAKKLEIPKFTEKYEANVKTLTGILEKYDCKVLNLAYLLTEDEFASSMTVDETANYTGRYKQADVIAREIARSI